MPKLTATQNLLIRACKSENPKKRLQSVYKRMYLYIDEYRLYRKEMIGILSNLFSEINKREITIIDIFSELDPNKYFFERESDYDFRERCLEVLISKIRNIPVSELPDDFRSPMRFK